MKANARNILFRILLVAYLAAIAYLCLGKFDNISHVPGTIFGIRTDKVVHFLMFFPFPFLAFFSFDQITRKPWHSLLFSIVIFGIGCFIAATTEVMQALLTSYRTGDIADFRADTLSMAISSVLVLILDILIKSCSKK